MRIRIPTKRGVRTLLFERAYPSFFVPCCSEIVLDILNEVWQCFCYQNKEAASMEYNFYLEPIPELTVDV